MYSKVDSRLYRGALLYGRYRIEALIGQGGMSYVYAAKDERLMGKLWAVKESIPFGRDHAHLMREAHWLTQLRHPNLPIIVDFFPPVEADHAYMVMELVEGETLAARMSRLTEGIPVHEVVAIAVQLCDALDYLHKQQPPIIYRDLKPTNVMINDKGLIKLIDFGIARQLREGAPTDTVKLGSIGYAAPEQYKGTQSDARTDLYAVGALLGTIVTNGRWCGTTPFRRELVNEPTTEPLVEIIIKLLSPKPEDRYSSAAALRIVLHHAVRGTVDDPSTITARDHRHISHIEPQFNANSPIVSSVIALLGTVSGIGTTHTSLSIAHTLARLRKGKVAYVDATSSSSKTVSTLKCNTAIHDVNNGWHGHESLDWNDVNHIHIGSMEGVSASHIMAQLQYDFDIVVLDLGSGGASNQLNEFMRATSSWLVGCAAPWREAQAEDALYILDQHQFSRWNYLLPHRAPDHKRQNSDETMCMCIVGFPTCRDPFAGHTSLDQWVKKWIVPNLFVKRKHHLTRWMKRLGKR